MPRSKAVHDDYFPTSADYYPDVGSREDGNLVDKYEAGAYLNEFELEDLILAANNQLNAGGGRFQELAALLTWVRSFFTVENLPTIVSIIGCIAFWAYILFSQEYFNKNSLNFIYKLWEANGGASEGISGSVVTGDKADSNLGTSIDKQTGTVISDEERIASCYYLGIGCQGKTDHMERFKDAMQVRFPDALTLSEALAKNGCNSLSYEEATKFLCTRGIVDKEQVVNALMTPAVCEDEGIGMTNLGCAYFKSCVSNVLVKHFSSPPTSPFDTRFRLAQDLRLDINRKKCVQF